MGLDQELYRKAWELYQWEMEFKGEPFDLLRREDISEEPWISAPPFPHIALGMLAVGDYTRYGFINLSNPQQIRYQPIARVHSSRAGNYHSDLLEMALSTLRTDVSGPAQLRLPLEFQKQVNRKHFEILGERQERLRGIGNAEALIYDTSIPSIRTAVIGHQLELFEQD